MSKPMVNSERTLKPETIDRKHAQAQNAIPAAKPIPPSRPPMKPLHASPAKSYTVSQASLYRGTPAERQEAKQAVYNAVSRPGTVAQHLERADKGIYPGKKPK